MIAKRILLALIVTGMMVISATVARAQSDENTAEKAAATQAGGLLDILERQKKAIAGSWLITPTVPGGPPFKVLINFNEDGTLVGAAQGDVDVQALVNSAGLGAWAHLGGRTFASTLLQIIYTPTGGNLVGLFKARGIHTLDSSGNEWSSTFKFEVFDPAGNVVFSGEGTAQAQRIKVELP